VTDDSGSLRDDYEELRAYALSPVKTPSRPLGLDLWLKRGFLSWIIAMLRRDSPTTPTSSVPARLENPVIPTGMVMSLSNILMEWSNKNAGQQNQERAFNP